MTLESAVERSERSSVSVVTAAITVITWLVIYGALVIVDRSFSFSFHFRIWYYSFACTVLGVVVGRLLAAPARLRTCLLQLKLGPWFAVGYSIVFGASSLTWLSPAVGTAAAVDQQSLFPAMLLSSVGLVGFGLGYLLCPHIFRSWVRAYQRSVMRSNANVLSASGVIALWSCSMAARFVELASGSYGYLSDVNKAPSGSISEVLALISQLGLCATLLAAWQLGRAPSPSRRALFVLVLTSQLVFGVFQANKEPFVVQSLAAIVGFGSSRRLRMGPIITAVVVFIFFVTPFVTLYRETVSTSQGRLTPGQVLAEVSFGSLTEGAIGSSQSASFSDFSKRLSRVGDLAIIVQKTPSSVPYAPSKELYEAPILGLIPRSIWSGKPVLNAGYQMSQVYYNLPRSVHTSSALTPYGDLWRHGGAWLVVVGMALMGFLARSVDSGSDSRYRDPRRLFLPILLFSIVVKQEIGYVAFLASLFGIFVSAAVACRLAGRGSLSAKAGGGRGPG